MRYTLSEIAAIVGGTAVGDKSATIRGVSAVEECGAGDITLALDQRRLSIAHSRNPAAIIVPKDFEEQCQQSRSYIVSAEPKMTFLRTLELFDPGVHVPDGVSTRATVCEGVSMGAGVKIGPNAYIGPGSVIGAGTVVFSGVYIGAQVEIGEDCVLFPNCVVMDRCEIGNRVRLHSGCVIGADGFGYVFNGSHHVKMPQIGRVIIEDDVEVGANSCIDRSTTAATVVAEGTKIDNLVQVAHNVKVGKLCILVGQSGIAGSSELGELCVLGGQAGVSDHTTVGSRTTIMANSIAAGTINPDSTVSGVPARDHRSELRSKVAVRKLPSLAERVERLERLMNQAETRVCGRRGPSEDQ